MHACIDWLSVMVLLDEIAPTRASEALAERFKTRHGEQRDCSQRTGISQSRLSRIARAKAMPRADESAVIERTEGIPAAWWAQPPVKGAA
jgi:transcriptional regulator with XRE-family HTH domain